MPSNESHFKLWNKTDQTITTTEAWIANAGDWDSNARPDKNLVGLKLAPGVFIERREELNYFAKHCNFSLRMHFSDGSIEEIGLDQKHAIGKGDSNMSRAEGGTHDIEYVREGSMYNVVTIKPLS